MFSRQNRSRFFLVALSVLIAAFSSPVMAQGAAPEMPAPIDALAKEGAQVRYLGNDLGLDGWLVIMKGTQQFFYTTADKKAMISGILYEADGGLVTAKQLQRLQSEEKNLIEQFSPTPSADAADALPKADALSKPSKSDYANLSPAEQLYLTVEHSNWVALGDKNAPVVYSFVDPQCPHCHDLVNKLRRGFLKRGMLQLRIIPVGLINEDSLKQAAFLLSAPDAEERFYKHLDGEKDALPVSNTFNTDGVELNIDVMRGWGLDVTPFSIYRDASNKVKIVKGLPTRMESMVNDLP